jgi:hypothetical protein
LLIKWKDFKFLIGIMLNNKNDYKKRYTYNKFEIEVSENLCKVI